MFSAIYVRNQIKSTNYSAIGSKNGRCCYLGLLYELEKGKRKMLCSWRSWKWPYKQILYIMWFHNSNDNVLKETRIIITEIVLFIKVPSCTRYDYRTKVILWLCCIFGRQQFLKLLAWTFKLLTLFPSSI